MKTRNQSVVLLILSTLVVYLASNNAISPPTFPTPSPPIINPFPTPTPTPGSPPSPSPSPGPTASPSPTSSPNASTGKLHAVETLLYDSSGQRVFLKGVNIHGKERGPLSNYFTFEDDIVSFLRFKSQSANCMRFYGEQLGWWMPTKGSIDVSHFTKYMDNYVNWCENNQIYYIINLLSFQANDNWDRDNDHFPKWLWQDGGYGYTYPLSESQQTNVIEDLFDLSKTNLDYARQLWMDCWKFVAERYKSNKYLIFGFMNEPFVGASGIDRDSVVRAGYKVMVERAIDTVRSVGADQMWCIEFPRNVDWTSNIYAINRPNVMWDQHHYVEPDWGDYISDFDNRVDNSIDRFINTLKQPLIIGEYGFSDNVGKDLNWYASEVSILDARSNKLSGRLWWEWSWQEGEYWAENSSIFKWNASDSEWILQTVLG